MYIYVYIYMYIYMYMYIVWNNAPKCKMVFAILFDYHITWICFVCM